MNQNPRCANDPQAVPSEGFRAHVGTTAAQPWQRTSLCWSSVNIVACRRPYGHPKNVPINQIQREIHDCGVIGRQTCAD